MKSSFWSDHERKLNDPEYARAFAAESVRIATIDSIMNMITEQIEAEGMTKATLARAIGANPSVVRRLLATGTVNPNPTLGTLAEIAGALGMKVTLEPMTASERKTITKPMVDHALGARRNAAAKTAVA